VNTPRYQFFALALFAIIIVAFIQPQFVSRAADPSPFKKLLATNASLAPNATQTHQLATAGKLCSLSVSIPTPSAMGDSGTIQVTLKDGDKVIASKPLHVGDPDLYLTFRATNATLELISHTKDAIAPTIQVLQWPDNKMPNVEAEPNDSWQDANEMPQTTQAGDCGGEHGARSGVGFAAAARARTTERQQC
jgi:hypothetical protein